MQKVTLIEGDWIGPECCAIVREVVQALNVNIEWDIQKLEDGHITEELIQSCLENRVIFKARSKSIREEGRQPASVELRKRLNLWSTIRPVKPVPNSNPRFPDIDVVVIRETSEDIYSGFEHEVTDGVYEAVKVTTRAACIRIAEQAYQYAKNNERKQVTIVHKSNIMKKSDGMFLEVAREVSKKYPEIKTTEMIVDALCENLCRNPYRYDVLLTLNLFGDLVSDLCSGLAGGITASPSMSEGYVDGQKILLFETIHGKAEGIIGMNKANPIPFLKLAYHMLLALGEVDASTRLENAVIQTLHEGILTEDMGGDASTVDVVTSILSKIKN